jgi:purine-cytosine permease-like protein
LAKVRFGTKVIDLPGSRIVRIVLGVLLILLGLLGFLPFLGFWMVPLGLIVLSADIPTVRRLNRRATVAISRWWTGRKARRRASPGVGRGAG